MHKRWRCTKCLQQTTGKALKSFAATSCFPQSKAVIASAVAAPDSNVRIGGQLAHASHSLLFEPRLLIHYCGTCGYYASLRAGRLAGACAPLTAKGKANLSRIRRGLWPQSASKGMPVSIQQELQEVHRSPGDVLEL